MRFRTRHELCLEMLDAYGSRLPHAWLTGNLAVPSNTTVREGEKGPTSSTPWLAGWWQRSIARSARRDAGGIRSIAEDGAVKHDYYLSNAPADTSLAEFAREANAEHRLEECIKRGKSEAGLTDYQVRNWLG